MTHSIDINCDVGEVSIDRDEALLGHVSSCNVCCGGHAGDPVLITSTIRTAVNRGVAVGAHPSYPDIEHFGRIRMEMSPSGLSDHLRFQIAAIKATTESFGSQLSHVKAHGALYHDIHQRPEMADVFLDVVADFGAGIGVMAMANSSFANRCLERRQPLIRESFGDRRYVDGKTLAPRSVSDGVIESIDDFDRQMLGLLAGKIIAADGQEHRIDSDSICLHSDSPSAIIFAERLEMLANKAGVTIDSVKHHDD